MSSKDRTLIMRIETGAMTDAEEDALVNELLRVAEAHGAAHVQMPLPMSTGPEP